MEILYFVLFFFFAILLQTNSVDKREENNSYFQLHWTRIAPPCTRLASLPAMKHSLLCKAQLHRHLVELADQPHQVVHCCVLYLVVVLTVHHYPGHVVVWRVQGLRLSPHHVLQSVPLGSLQDIILSSNFIIF